MNQLRCSEPVSGAGVSRKTHKITPTVFERRRLRLREKDTVTRVTRTVSRFDLAQGILITRWGVVGSVDFTRTTTADSAGDDRRCGGARGNRRDARRGGASLASRSPLAAPRLPGNRLRLEAKAHPHQTSVYDGGRGKGAHRVHRMTNAHIRLVVRTTVWRFAAAFRHFGWNE